MHALIAPDKFKGSLTAREVADSLAEGMRASGAEITTLPLADGGDGSVDAAVSAGLRHERIRVAAALGDLHTASYAHNAFTAVVEIANTCGLVTLPAGHKDPLRASSLGAGQALRAALRHRTSRVVLALGGSASSDAGVGLLSALGFTFRDDAGKILTPDAASLPHIARIEGHSLPGLDDVELLIAGDVTNPLTGPDGAAHVYGPQKGADTATVQWLDAAATKFVDVLSHNGFPAAHAIAANAGAGAAGGAGFAAMLLGGRMVSGADFFLDLLDFDAHRATADLVITGEGRIDRQTTHGKLLSALAARAHPTPVVAVAGRNDLPRQEWARGGFTAVHALADLTTLDTAADPALTRRLLTQVGRDIAREHSRSAAGARGHAGQRAVS
ncbi:glycerate kinase [uncultured Gordonia sp.]|uniref:glycerate kinase n=1 Tax=uncultured Gordonia sp. TaxID=198437 RepID=UPI002592E595|nr:glycerate kinase [uncultured Gordonia sp.]